MDRRISASAKHPGPLKLSYSLLSVTSVPTGRAGLTDRLHECTSESVTDIRGLAPRIENSQPFCEMSSHTTHFCASHPTIFDVVAAPPGAEMLRTMPRETEPSAASRGRTALGLQPISAVVVGRDPPGTLVVPEKRTRSCVRA